MSGLPGVFSSGRLSPETISVSNYSGGTVRESHPVVLFSIPGSAPGMPRSGLSNCHDNDSTALRRSQILFADSFPPVCSAAQKPPAPAAAAEQIAKPAQQEVHAGIASHFETGEIAGLLAVGRAAVLDPVQGL